jgi:predicted nucleic acid-binding protein
MKCSAYFIGPKPIPLGWLINNLYNEKLIILRRPASYSLLDEIISHGFRVADELYQEILIKADEIREQRA